MIYASNSIGTVFKGNATITSFKELAKFNNITTLYQAFNGCKNLTNININNIIDIGDYSFVNCSKLANIGNLSWVNHIGTQALYGCTLIESLSLDSIITITGEYNFKKCTFTSLLIGEKCTSIGSYTFCDCSLLKYFKILPVTPPSIGTGVFDYTNNCPIYVPDASVDAYKAATNWSSYASRIKSLSTLTQ